MDGNGDAIALLCTTRPRDELIFGHFCSNFGYQRTRTNFVARRLNGRAEALLHALY